MSDGMEIFGLDEAEIEMENTSIEDIDSEIANLIFVAIDGSGSMGTYTNAMQSSLSDFKTALADSKEVDEMLIARADFRESTVDVGGYKPVDQFSVDYHASGMTPLYDVVVEGTDKLLKYMDYLIQQGMRVKAVFAVFSDGQDTSSKAKLKEAQEKIKKLNEREIATAFISFGNDAVSEAKNLGFKNLLTVGSSASELRRAFNCLSKSVIESSKSVVSTDSFSF